MLITDVDLLSAEGAPLARGDLVNMSRSGARLDLGVPLEEGRRVSLAVSVPGQMRPFRLEAEVLWQRAVPTGFAHGVRFHTVGPDEAAFLAEILEARS